MAAVETPASPITEAEDRFFRLRNRLIEVQSLIAQGIQSPNLPGIVDELTQATNRLQQYLQQIDAIDARAKNNQVGSQDAQNRELLLGQLKTFEKFEERISADLATALGEPIEVMAETDARLSQAHLRNQDVLKEAERILQNPSTKQLPQDKTEMLPAESNAAIALPADQTATQPPSADTTPLPAAEFSVPHPETAPEIRNDFPADPVTEQTVGLKSAADNPSGGEETTAAGNQTQKDITELTNTQRLTLLHDFVQYIAQTVDSLKTTDHIESLLPKFLATDTDAKYRDVQGITATYLFNELHDFATIDTEAELFEHASLIASQLEHAITLSQQFEGQLQAGILPESVVADYKKSLAESQHAGSGDLAADLAVFNTYLKKRAAQAVVTEKLPQLVNEKVTAAKDQYALQVLETIQQNKQKQAEQAFTQQTLQVLSTTAGHTLSQDEADAAVFIADSLFNEHIPLDQSNVTAYLNQHNEALGQQFRLQLVKEHKGAEPKQLEQKAQLFTKFAKIPELFTANAATNVAIAQASHAEAFTGAIRTLAEKAKVLPAAATTPRETITSVGAIRSEATKPAYSTGLEAQGLAKKIAEQLRYFEEKGVVFPPGVVESLDTRELNVGVLLCKQALAQAPTSVGSLAASGESFDNLMAEALKRAFGSKLQFNTQALVSEHIGEQIAGKNFAKEVDEAALFFQLTRALGGDQQAQEDLPQTIVAMRPELASMFTQPQPLITAQPATLEQSEDPIAVTAETITTAPDMLAAVSEDTDEVAEEQSEQTSVLAAVSEAAASSGTQVPTEDLEAARAIDANPQAAFVEMVGAEELYAMAMMAAARGNVADADILHALVTQANQHHYNQLQKQRLHYFLARYAGNSSGSFSKQLAFRMLRDIHNKHSFVGIVANRELSEIPGALFNQYLGNSLAKTFRAGRNSVWHGVQGSSKSAWRWLNMPRAPMFDAIGKMSPAEYLAFAKNGGMINGVPAANLKMQKLYWQKHREYEKAAQAYADRWQKYRQSKRYKYFHQPVINRYKNAMAWKQYYGVQLNAFATRFRGRSGNSVALARAKKVGRFFGKVGNSFSNAKKKFSKLFAPFKRLNKFVNKILGPISEALLAWALIRKLLRFYKRIMAVLSLYLIALWYWLLGQVGALVGAVIGGIAGAAVGAYIGVQVGAAIGGVLGTALCLGFFVCGIIGSVVGGVLGGFLGGLLGGAIGATVGAILGYAFQHLILANLAGAGAGAGIGYILTFGNPLGAMAGAYIGAQIEVWLKHFVFPHWGTGIEVFISNLLHSLGSLVGQLGTWAANLLSTFGSLFGLSGVVGFLGSLGGIFSVGAGLAALIVVGTIIIGVLTTDDTNPALTGSALKLTAPASVANGETIPYTLTATFASCASRVTIEAPLPQNTTYQSLGVPVVQNGQSITAISGILSATGLHWDIALNGQGSCNGGGTSNGPNHVSGSYSEANFAALLRGQGREMKALGSGEDAFVQSLLKNTKHPLSKYESQLRQIYETAAAKNVNPLLIVVLSGTEQGFNMNHPYVFSCAPEVQGGPPGFTNQLNCAVNTFNNEFNQYEKLVSDPSNNGKAPIQKVDSNGTPIPGQYCYYDDPLLYALEVYGPVCHSYDHNDDFHSMFYQFYQDFTQG